MLDIEEVIVQYLNSFGEAPASTAVPAERPKEFYTVEWVGGGLEVHPRMAYPYVAIQCWAESRWRALRMAKLTAERIGSIRNTIPDIKRVDDVSFYNFPDLDSGQARAQVMATMWVVD